MSVGRSSWRWMVLVVGSIRTFCVGHLYGGVITASQKDVRLLAYEVSLTWAFAATNPRAVDVEEVYRCRTSIQDLRFEMVLL